MLLLVVKYILQVPKTTQYFKPVVDFLFALSEVFETTVNRFLIKSFLESKIFFFVVTETKREKHYKKKKKIENVATITHTHIFVISFVNSLTVKFCKDLQ